MTDVLHEHQKPFIFIYIQNKVFKGPILVGFRFFLKLAQTRYREGFWGGESRGIKIFLVRALLTLTGPLLKIGAFTAILTFHH